MNEASFSRPHLLRHAAHQAPGAAPVTDALSRRRPLDRVGQGEMAENIEIKARCPDLVRAEQIARALGAKRVGTEWQRDTYFVLPPERAAKGARLKLRERAGGAQLIPYFRPHARAPKRSRYAVIPVESPRLLRALLSELFGVAAVVEKRRTIFLLDNVRIHLDRVRRLGTFIEFEALVEKGAKVRARASVRRLMKQFGIRRSDLLTSSYADVLQNLRPKEKGENEGSRGKRLARAEHRGGV